MIAFLTEWIDAIWVVLVESGPYLLAGFLIAGLIKVFVPASAIYRHLGRDDFRSVTIASLAGIPIPLCSCSVIPTAISLKKSGASKGATTSFLIATPETGVDSIGVTWALMDPIMTVVRPVAALLDALLSGAVVNWIVRRGLDDHPDGALPLPDAGDGDQAHGHDHGHAHDHDHDHGHGHGHDHDDETGEGPWYRRALRYAFGTLLDDLTPWFVLGFLVSGLIMVLVPDDFFGGVLPGGWLTMVAMLFVGVPMYICATASTPVAAALIAKGLDPGAALVLMIAGPATNVATMGVVSRFLGRRILVAYLATTALAALSVGAVVNWIYARLEIDPRTIVDLERPEGHGTVALVSGVVLTLLLLGSARRLRLDRVLGRWLRRVGAPLGIDPTGRPAKVLGALVLLLLYASTAVSAVGPGEVGFRERFGEVLEVRDRPGPVVHLPYPFETVEVVRRDAVRGLDFGFLREESDELVSPRTPRRLAEESEVLTGDENILSVTYTVHYRVRDARRYLYGLSDPEALVGDLTQAGVRRALGRRRADDVLVASRPEIEAEVRANVQAEADALAMGVEVLDVQLLDLHAPRAVHEAFRDIASALEEAEAELKRGEMYEKNRLAKARGDAYRIVQEAEAERIRLLEDARARVAAFEAIQAADAEDPATNRLRLQYEALLRAYLRPRLVLELSEVVEAVLLPRSPVESPADIFTPRPDERARR